MSKEYQICQKCVMDTSDPFIEFNERGICNHCTTFENYQEPNWLRGERGINKIEEMISLIKKEGVGKDYDCIIGLSGGVDSSYLAYWGWKNGLRMLAVHVDAGWNTDVAVSNIEKLCNKLKIDLVTEVIDWDAMRKIQIAFFRSQVVNQDIPQDHAFFASLYKYASKKRIKYVLNGFNTSTECIMADAWRGNNAMDKSYIKDVYNKYGEGKQFPNFPLISLLQFRFLYRIKFNFKIVTPLNYLNYSKTDAINLLINEIGFVDYGGKHKESRFTHFHQSYYLPNKFNYDKRRAHLSSLIVTKQLDRKEALEILKMPHYKNEIDQENEINYICKKLNFTREEFDALMKVYPEDNFKSDKTFGEKLDILSKYLSKIFNR